MAAMKTPDPKLSITPKKKVPHDKYTKSGRICSQKNCMTHQLGNNKPNIISRVKISETSIPLAHNAGQKANFVFMIFSFRDIFKCIQKFSFFSRNNPPLFCLPNISISAQEHSIHWL